MNEGYSLVKRNTGEDDKGEISLPVLSFLLPS